MEVNPVLNFYLNLSEDMIKLVEDLKKQQYEKQNNLCQMDSVYDYEHVTPAMAQYFSNTPGIDVHKGHETVENEALGKKFKYCRDCKKEVV
jgi:hypothetical protein